VSREDFASALALAAGDVQAAIEGVLQAVADGRVDSYSRKMAASLLSHWYARRGDPMWVEWRTRAAREEVLGHMESWDKGFVVGFSLSDCAVHAGRVFSFEEALAVSPFPCGCECRCWWRVRFASDYGYESEIR